MLRFIIKRKVKCQYNGGEEEVFETVDAEVPGVEAMLRRGGFSEGGYDYSHLVGIELLAAQPARGGGR